MSACPLTNIMAMLVAIAAWTYAGAMAAAPEALERPASFSARAGSSVMLAVTRVGQRLVAVGERGIVLYSDDGGASWQQAQVPVSTSLTHVHFRGGGKGWAVGHSGIVLHSTDAGATWVKQFDGKQAAALMLNAAEKAASEGNDQQAQTRLRDARRIAAEGPDKPFFAVHFLDEQRGFIAGAYGLFFSTEDGGRTWLPCHTRIDNPDGKHLYSISALGTSVYIAGEQGALYRSADAGDTFTAIRTPYAGSYFGVTVLARGEVLVYGLKGHAYRSDDGTRDWRKVETGSQAGISAALALANGSVVMVTQAGEALHGTGDDRGLQALALSRRFPFSGVAQADDASLVLSGVRGLVRIPIQRAPK